MWGKLVKLWILWIFWYYEYDEMSNQKLMNVLDNKLLNEWDYKINLITISFIIQTITTNIWILFHHMYKSYINQFLFIKSY
jgi:hypothetical protein